MFLKKIFFFILTFFRVIYLFESKKNKNIINYKHIELKKFKSKKLIKSPIILEYLKKDNKKDRFYNDQILFVLFYKKKIVSFGWMHEGSNWVITEINKKITIKNSIFLFDFFTLPNFRNKGFYTKILNLIKNKKTNKLFYIYCLQNNKKSTKGILNANFILKNKITRLKNV